MEKVAAIIVTYNRLELLKKCVESLKKQTYKNYSIIIVNNGSTDGTDYWLNNQKDIKVISQHNMGGAGGFYTGLKYACENGFDYSWIMDDDVEAYQDTLEQLMRHTNKTKGFICSRVLDVNRLHCNVPRISNKISNETGEKIWGKELNENLIGVDMTSFVSVLVPTKTIYEVGLPYQEYFIWGDDSEYTQRISSKYDSFMAIDSRILHKRNVMSVLSIFSENNPNRIKLYYYLYRNRLHFSKKYTQKIGLFIEGINHSIKLLLRGEIRKASVVVKGCVAGILFNPKLKFPNKAY